MEAFQIVQIAVAVLLGNVMTKCLFSGWAKIKTDQYRIRDLAFYIAPLGLVALVLIGSR